MFFLIKVAFISGTQVKEALALAEAKKAARPVCYSLHKFFKSASPVQKSEAAVQAWEEKLAPQSWQERQRQLVSQSGLSNQELVQAAELKGRQSLAAIPDISQQYKGGRPKRGPWGSKRQVRQHDRLGEALVVPVHGGIHVSARQLQDQSRGQGGWQNRCQRGLREADLEEEAVLG